MLEPFAGIDQMTEKMRSQCVDENRKSDHISYTSNLAEFGAHNPNWSITIGLDEILRQLIAGQTQQILSLETRN